MKGKDKEGKTRTRRDRKRQGGTDKDKEEQTTTRRDRQGKEGHTGTRDKGPYDLLITDREGPSL